ncbi:response regulator transcription factor [Vibrio sp. E150_011]
MTSQSSESFETLLMSQSVALSGSQPVHFEDTFDVVARQVLDWFQLDRLTLFPNSMLLLNDERTMSVAKTPDLMLDKVLFASGNYINYIDLLKSKSIWQSFDHQALRTSPITPLKLLYSQGGRWHGIIRLELFGEVWGALAFTQFGEPANGLSDKDFRRLKIISDTWLCYWQHSIIARSLNKGAETAINDSEKLLLLSKKQCSVLELLAKGYSAKQCADALFLSPRTIESHKYRMIDVLRLKSHAELIQFALRNGFGIGH